MCGNTGDNSWFGVDSMSRISLQLGWMVGRARLARDEAGHWISRFARAEQVGRREEVKVAGSEN